MRHTTYRRDRHHETDSGYSSRTRHRQTRSFDETDTTVDNYRRQKRFQWVFLLLAGIAAAIILKLVWVQIIDNGRLKDKAQKSRSQSAVLYNRGRILDRNGVILAQDSILYDLYAHHNYFDKVKAEQIATALAPVLKKPAENLLIRLSEPMQTVTLAKNLSKHAKHAVDKLRVSVTAQDPKTQEVLRNDNGQPIIRHVPIPGLDFARKTVRNYPQGNLAAHLLGYVNDEADISVGTEYTARNTLRARPAGMRLLEFDGRGDMINVEKFRPEDLVSIPAARDVKLTIDSRLQYIAERELAAGLERTKSKRGAVVMMDPHSGELLAFAVLPTYSPDQYFKASAEELKNWALTDVYPPGSTLKILTVASGIDSGVINKDSHILDTGKMTVGGWEIKNYDYSKRPHPGNISLVDLLQHSSNIGSAKIAMMVPRATHHETLKKFGIGQKTGIDLPGESQGILLPTSKWDDSTRATIGFGYGLASTPIQMAAAVSSIANGGMWVQPHVLKTTRKPATHRVLKPETARAVTELLVKSIETAGTSTVRLEQFRVAGKTGTSRKPNDNGRGYSNQLFTSFVGFFPAEKPRVLVMVVMDSPGIGEAWGSTVAGPIFKNIAEDSIGYLGLKPAKIATKSPAPKAAH